MHDFVIRQAYTASSPIQRDHIRKILDSYLGTHLRRKNYIVKML